MNAANWITLVLFALAAIGAILKAQHSLITKLLADRWALMERRQDETNERIDDTNNDLAETNKRLAETNRHVDRLDRQMFQVETVCRARHIVGGGG